MSYKSVHYHYRYAYVGNDPINYIDPFGLFNINTVFSGVTQSVKGVLKVIGGEVPTPEVPTPEVPTPEVPTSGGKND